MNLDKLKDKLKSNGFTPQDGVPNSITFMFEGGHYYLDIDVKDDNYVRVGYPKFWTLEGPDSLREMQAASKTTESLKAVKVFVLGDGVYGTVEQFVEGEDMVMRFFPRYLRTLQGAAKAFAEHMATGS